MKQLLRKTDIPVKQPGSGISLRDINTIVSVLDQNVETMNLILKSQGNLWLEENDGASYTLEEAIVKVPVSRRSPGFRLTFKMRPGTALVEYMYVGSMIDLWEDPTMWVKTSVGNNMNGITIIDGGDW